MVATPLEPERAKPKTGGKLSVGVTGSVELVVDLGESNFSNYYTRSGANLPWLPQAEHAHRYFPSRSRLGYCMGCPYPRGSRVWVPMGMGTGIGTSSDTHDLRIPMLYLNQ